MRNSTWDFGIYPPPGHELFGVGNDGEFDASRNGTPELFGVSGMGQSDAYRDEILGLIPRMTAAMSELSSVLPVMPSDIRADAEFQIKCIRDALTNIERQKYASPGAAFRFDRRAWDYLQDCTVRAENLRRMVGAVTEVVREVKVPYKEEVIREVRVPYEVEVPVEVRRAGFGGAGMALLIGAGALLWMGTRAK